MNLFRSQIQNWSTAQKTGFVISDCHFQCWFLVHLYRSLTAVGDERLDWVAGHLMFYWRSSAGRCHTSSLLSLLVHWKQISSCQPVVFCIVNNTVYFSLLCWILLMIYFVILFTWIYWLLKWLLTVQMCWKLEMLVIHVHFLCSVLRAFTLFCVKFVIVLFINIPRK